MFVCLWNTFARVYNVISVSKLVSSISYLILYSLSEIYDIYIVFNYIYNNLNIIYIYINILDCNIYFL